MFVGREKELKTLSKMMQSANFEFFVLYGQRRIGKTTLISEFIKDKEAIFMTAKEVNDQLNLQEFTRKIEVYFEYRKNTLDFLTWESAFIFISKQSEAEEVLVIIIEAVARGAQTPSQIEQITGIEKNPASAYIKTLVEIGFLTKRVPFGENPLKSRKGNYSLGNLMFQFWFNYVSPNFSDIQLGNGSLIYNRRVSHLIDDYIGKFVFEQVCLQYLLRCNGNDSLPFLASKAGKWWGNDSVNQTQTDVDVIVADREYSNSIILGECKWKVDIKEVQEIEKLRQKGALFKGYEHYYYYFFLKGCFKEETKAYYKDRTDVTLKEMEQLLDE